HDDRRWQSGWRIRRSKQVRAAEIENEFDAAVGSNVLGSFGRICRLMNPETLDCVLEATVRFGLGISLDRRLYLVSSCRRHHWYGGVWGHPAGESSQVSCRPNGVRSRKLQGEPSISTPRPSVK